MKMTEIEREYSITNHPIYQTFKLNDNANKILQHGTEILAQLGVFYWLSGGTALGLYRDKEFIKNDTDIDVEVLGNRRVNDIYNNFLIDYELVREVSDNTGFIYQQAYYSIKDCILFDIIYYREQENKVVSWSETNGEISYPAIFLAEMEPITFNNRIYPIINPEKYLEWIYGKEWKTPVSKDKTTYSWGKE
jgi:phosphorylcholine metabolism protein LicD